MLALIKRVSILETVKLSPTIAVAQSAQAKQISIVVNDGQLDNASDSTSEAIHRC